MRAFSPATSPVLAFALLAGLAAFALAAFSPGLLNDSDTYWHIRAGEWMLAHHQVLRADVFSYTAAGAPWRGMMENHHAITRWSFEKNRWPPMSIRLPL